MLPRKAHFPRDGLRFHQRVRMDQDLYPWRTTVSPDEFISKWDGVKLKEKQAYQEHFLDLCVLVGANSPAKDDPEGVWFCFEKGASKAGGGEGWADVWRQGHFAWEYKSPGKDLDKAFEQLQKYTPTLRYPPLLIVSDI